MHRLRLPIAAPCDGGGPEPGTSFCGRCEQHVHDLSALTERELARFLDAHVGQRICISYRSTDDGRIAVRPEPRVTALAAAVLGLAACSWVSPTLEPPGAPSCVDDRGYPVGCPLHPDDEPPLREAMLAPPDVPMSPESVPWAQASGPPLGKTDEWEWAGPLGARTKAEAKPWTPPPKIEGGISLGGCTIGEDHRLERRSDARSIERARRRVMRRR